MTLADMILRFGIWCWFECRKWQGLAYQFREDEGEECLEVGEECFEVGE